MKDGFSAIRSDLRAELHGVEAGLRTELHEVRDGLRAELHEVRDGLRVELHDVRDTLRGEMRALRDELRDDIRIGVEESQNLTRGLHAEAMQAIASVDASIRRDVVSRLDQLLDRQRPPSA